MGALSYWESDIMRVNQVVILLKFLPLALLITNFAAAFSFISYCVPFRQPGSMRTMANCTRALVVSGNKFDIKSKFLKELKIDELACDSFDTKKLRPGRPSGALATCIMWYINYLVITVNVHGTKNPSPKKLY